MNRRNRPAPTLVRSEWIGPEPWSIEMGVLVNPTESWSSSPPVSGKSPRLRHRRQLDLGHSRAKRSAVGSPRWDSQPVGGRAVRRVPARPSFRAAPEQSRLLRTARCRRQRGSGTRIGLNSAIPAGLPRIPAPEAVLGEQGNRPATTPVRSEWIEPQPWSIRPEAPVDSARAMGVWGWSHGQPRIA